jgi:riboflavin kinase/FMN adenylyltransferase
VKEYLVGKLGMVGVCVGSNFVFGRDRQGDIKMLRSLGREMHFETHAVRKVLQEGQPVSSSLIRSNIKSGKVSDAGLMLGRPYSIEGRVSHGAGRGRTIGYPTVNLEEVRNLLPAPGVYITETEVEAKKLPSATYIGPRPTFRDATEAIESHILDYDEKIYGEWVRLTFFSRLRPVTKFRSADALREAIAKDIKKIRRFFRERKK